MAHKLAQWFVSERGRIITFRCVCAATLGVYGLYTVPHTFLLDKYKDVVQLYRSGIPVNVSQIVQERFDKALDLLEIRDIDKKCIKPFTVFGFDVFNAGTTYSKYGAYIGIPVNFSYSDESEIDKGQILVDNAAVEWSLPEAKQLLHSLVLSEKAQLFAIAREISFVTSTKLFLDTIYGTATCIIMYGLGYHINNKFNLYSRPFPVRGTFYSIIAVFGYGLYALLTDFTQNTFDSMIDKELCEKNEIFAQGGKEFYEKLLMRNIALRKLLGTYGESKYSNLGNENYLIRQKHVPLVVRREYFANKLENVL